MEQNKTNKKGALRLPFCFIWYGDYLGIIFNTRIVEYTGHEGNSSCAIHVNAGLCEAFRGCTSLQSIDIPEKVTSIGSKAFYQCSNLTTVSLAEGLISIGKAAGEMSPSERGSVKGTCRAAGDDG